MTAEERAALLAARDALTGILAMGPTLKQKGHVPGCCFGYWLGRDCQPEPCTRRCREAQQAEAAASRLLDATEVRQGLML